MAAAAVLRPQLVRLRDVRHRSDRRRQQAQPWGPCARAAHAQCYSHCIHRCVLVLTLSPFCLAAFIPPKPSFGFWVELKVRFLRMLHVWHAPMHVW